MSRVRAYDGAELVYDSDVDEQSFEDFLVSSGGARVRVEVEGTMGAETSPDFPIHEKVEE